MLKVLWRWYPLVGLLGFGLTGVIAALGGVSMFAPLAFWLVMAVWVWSSFDEQRKKMRRLLDRVANEDH
jgi:hypothetical protein